MIPPAKKPPTRSRPEFKEPAAPKRLNRSLDAAEEALAELGKDTGRDLGQAARDLYKDLRTFLSSARRHTAKLAKALQRDFEQARGGRARSRGAGTGATRRRTAATKPARRTTKSS